MRIIFMGTPDFAVPALKKLIDAANHEVIAVYTQPPRPKGRGMQVQKSPVHELADTHGIEVFTPKSLRKSPEEQEKFTALNADIAIVAAYGLLLPQNVLDAPKYGCLNIHGSLLPRWRGASPIQHAIWKGDDVTGVTIMKMDEGLDTGDMIAKGEAPITPTTTSADLYDILSKMGGDMVIDVIDDIGRTGQIKAEKQDDTLATFAPLLAKSDGDIDPNVPIKLTDRQIRALNPWPGTFVQGLKGRVKILSAHVEDDKLIYDIVQPEGKSKMDYASAKNGGYLV